MHKTKKTIHTFIFIICIWLGVSTPSISFSWERLNQTSFNIQYSTEEPTNQPVTIKIQTTSKTPLTLINNNQSSTYTFTKNGTFTFIYKNWLQQTITKTVEVSNIDLTPPQAKLTGIPQNPVGEGTAQMWVIGTDIDSYRYRLLPATNWSDPIKADQPLQINEMKVGSYKLEIIAGDAVGNWQSEDLPTSYAWEVTKNPSQRNRMTPLESGNKAIEISIEDQHLWAYEGQKLIFQSPVTTGTYDLYTTPGDFHIYEKASPKWYPGGYKSKYWLRFNGGMGIHDAPWRNPSDFGTEIWKWGGSHGCVNMPPEAGQWIYSWAELGTPVKVYDHN